MRPMRGVAARVGVLVVDTGLILLVLLWGVYTHGTPTAALLGDGFPTAAPFLAGWLIVAPPLGVYRASNVTRPRRGFPRVIGGWLAACLIGAAVRASPLVAGGASWVFVGVVFGVVGTVLVIWRTVVALAGRA